MIHIALSYRGKDSTVEKLERQKNGLLTQTLKHGFNTTTYFSSGVRDLNSIAILRNPRLDMMVQQYPNLTIGFYNINTLITVAQDSRS